jgi:uncharacterized protein
MKTVEKPLLELVTRRLVEEFDAEQVILFGSHAWGTPTDDSDVDLLVVVREDSAPASRRSQRAHRCLGGLGIPKDILVHTRAEVYRAMQVRTSLVRQIIEQGRVLYDRTSSG